MTSKPKRVRAYRPHSATARPTATSAPSGMRRPWIDQLDQVVPYLMPVVLTGLIYFLFRKYNLHPLWAIVIVFALGLFLGWNGWFTNVAPAPPSGS